MQMKQMRFRSIIIIASTLLFCAQMVSAANGTWNGTSDALWTNDANWSASPYPSGAETATFTNAADIGQTTIDIDGLTSINNIIFDSPSVAAYTNGTGAANSQTLILGDNGIITLTDTAANSQLFNCGLQLGATIGGSTYTLTNGNVAQTLTFNNVFGPASGGTAGGKTLVVSGAGNTTILGGLVKGGATSMQLTDRSSGTVTLKGSNTINTVYMEGSGALVLPGSNFVTTLNMNGTEASVVDIGDGFLTLSSGGGTTLNSTQGGIINGTGKLWLSVDPNNAGNYADNSVAAGKTLVINTSIISPAGFEFWGGGTTFGTFVLNATNTFEKDVTLNVPGTISVWKIGNKGSTTSNLGKGNTITFNGNPAPGAKLLYTGTGEESDRTLSLTLGAVLDHSGTGLLKFTAPLLASGNAKTLTLQGSTSGIGEIAGVIPNGAGTSLEKTGTGTWILSAVNTYPGATTIKNGKLIVTTAGSCASSAVKLQSSGAGATAVLSLSISDSAKQWTCSSLTTTNDAGNPPVLDFAFYMTPGPSLAPLSVTGNVVFDSQTAITVNPVNLVPGNSYPLLIAGGSVPATAPTSVTIGGGLTGSVSWGTGTPYTTKTLVLAVSGASTTVLPLHWTGLGEGSGTWNLNTPGNLVWTNSAIPPEAAYYQEGTAGDQVMFDDAHISTAQIVTLDETVKPSGVTFDNSLYGYTVTGNGSISGFTKLNKFGTNTLTLGTANTYSDITALKAGTLKLGNSLALPAGNIVSMSGTATLDLNGYAPTINNISDSFASNLITDNSEGAETNALSILNHATKLSAFIKDGTSKKVALSLRNNNAGFESFPATATNTFSGGLLLKNGSFIGAGTRLRIMSPVTTLGTPGSITSSPFGTGPITIGEAGTDKAQILLDTVANNTIANDIVVNTSLGTDAGYALRADTAGNRLTGAVRANADFSLGGTGTGVLTVDNVISGTGGVRVSSATLNLTGANTYAGRTTIAGGVLAVPSINNVGSGSGPLGNPATAADGAIRIGSGGTAATLRYTGMGETTTRIIDMAGTTGGATLDHAGTNLLRFTSDLLISGVGAKQLKLQGSTVSTGEVAGVISDSSNGAVNLYKDNINSTWIVSNTNLFSGGVTLYAGKLIIATSTGLGISNKTVNIAVYGTLGNPQLHLDGSAGAITLGTNLTFQTSNVNGAIKNSAGTNTINAAKINLTGGGGDTTVESMAGKLTLAGRITSDYTASGRNLRLRGNGDGEVSGNIDNGSTSVGLYRETGAGTWTLSGTNTYTGATTVSGGTLLVNGATASGSAVTVSGGGTLGGTGTISGTVTVTLGGTLTAGGRGSIGTLTLARNSATSLTLNNGTLLFDLPSSGLECDKIDITGASGKLVLTNANKIALSFPYGPAPQGRYVLMTCTAGITTNMGASLTLQGSYPNANLVVEGNEVVLNVGEGGTSGMTWQGNLSDVWDGGIPNWTNGSAAAAFEPGQNVVFDDTGVSFAVSSGSPVAPASVMFNNSDNDYTVSAAMDGTTTLTKLGSGALTLSGTNTYIGATIIGGGTLTIGGAGLLNNGTYAGAIMNAGMFNYVSSEPQTLSGIISGEGTLSKVGAATLTLSGANTYNGPTIVNAGVLKIQNANALGTTAAGTTVNAGGRLDLAGNISTSAETLDLYGILSSQTGSNTYTGVVSLRTGSSLDAGPGAFLILTASTPDVGAAPFSKTGAGTVRLTADPNHRGVCTVAEGNLELMGGGSTDADFIIDAGATLMETTANLGDFRLTDNGTFDLRVSDQIGGLDGSGIVAIGNTGSYTFSVGGANQSGAFSGVIQDGTGKMSFQKNGSGVQILSGVNTYTGTTTVAGGTLLVNSPGSLAANSAVTVNNSCTLGGSGTIYGTVNVVAGGALLPGDTNVIATLKLGNSSLATLTLNGNILRYDISNELGTCDKIEFTGAGSLVLNGVNFIALSFPNGVAPAGDYTLMTFQSYTGTGSFALSGNYPSNASVELTPNSLILHVSSASPSSGMTWRGPQSGIWDNGIQNWTTNNSDLVAYTPGNAVIFDDTAMGYFTVSSGSPVSPDSVLFNNSVNAYTVSAFIGGTGPLVKLGTGAVTLSGVNAYNPSGIDIYPGTLTLGGASALNSGAYAGNIINNGTFAYASSVSQTLSGNISGSGALSKSGSSTLILSGTNTYVGATTVSAGTLKIRSGYVRGTTAGNMTVNGGAKLEMEAGVNTLMEMLYLTGTLSCPTGVTTCAGNVYTYTGSIFDVAEGAILIISGNTMDTGTGNAIIKTNAGLLRITKDPNHKGTMTIKGGAVELAANTSDGDYVINAGASLIGNTSDAVGNNNGVTINAGGFYILRQSDTINMFTGAGTLTKDTTGAATLSIGNNNGSGTFPGVIENGAGTISFAKNGSGTYTLSGTNTYTGSTTINSGVLMIDGAGLLGNGLYTGAIVNKATLVYASTAPQTVSGVISDAGALRKIGTGRLILTGTNTYSGATSISNGILTGVTGGGCTNSAVTVQASPSGAVAILGVRYTGANAKWTCNSLTTGAGASGPRVLFTFATTPSTTIAPLEVRGNVTFDASTVLQAALPANIGAGVYPLLVAGGTTSGTPTLTPLGNGLTGGLAWGAGGFSAKTLVLTITSTGATTQPLKWNETSPSGTWNVNVAGNAIWLDNAGTPTIYQESVVGDHVLFDDTVIGDITVTLSTSVNPASVSINNEVANYTLSGSGGISGDAILTKSGTNTMTFATANTYQGGSTVSLGTLRVASGGAISHAGADIIVGNSNIGSSNALLKIENGASVLTKWLQAGTANGAVGAIHNKGTLAISSVNNTICFALGSGVGGYGYYRHETAKTLIVPEIAVAASPAGSTPGGDGVLDIVQGAVTNSLYFLVNRGTATQYGQVNVTGGSLIMPDSNANGFMFGYAGGNGQGMINVGANSMLGSLGSSTELDLIKTSTSGSAIGILNIFGGGIVEASRIKASQSGGMALVSFNGGTLKAKYPAYGTGPLLGGSSIDRATIYENGAVIDTVGNDLIVSQPLLAPTGDGIIAIPVTAKGTGYIGRPVVYITGGGGTGATAVADFNPETQEVTGIIVTSPGYGYTTPSGIVVTLTGGGGIPPTLGTASIGAMTSGGLTKIGAGCLTLSGASTYTGMTTISNGTLRLGAGNALPSNAAVTLAGGDYDLSGLATTNGPITVISGSVLSGLLKASGITKSGDGVSLFTATLTDPAPIIIDKGTLLLSKAAGLYEGRVAGAFELALSNPQTGVQLCPTNAYRPTVNSNQTCGRWVDNSTYIYTGYIWNRSSSNETWTFCKSFDDSVLIKIDGTPVINVNGNWDTVVTANHIVTPGPHVFEVRLGQGAGGVGQANNKTVPGAGFDRLGRSTGTLCVPIFDPGDGSLLTHSLVYGTNQLATASTVQVATNAALNLGGMVQTLAEVSGSGLVTNGTLAVTGVVAPGGTNIVGTLTLATTNTLTGTLRVDVSEDGTCDVLAIKGDVNVSGMALTADVIGQLSDRKLQYTILTCTGTRTGLFGTKTLPSGWIVSYEDNGDVKLLFAGNTILRLY